MQMKNSYRIADIHTHILPNIDDGPKDVSESLDMLRLEIEQGVTDVVLTPHFILANQSIEDFLAKREASFNTLSNEVHQSGLNINLHLGAEVRYDPNLVYSDIFKLCIGDTSYLLLELTGSYPFNFEQTIYNLLARGVYPILAHIERYDYLISNPKLMTEFLEEGVIFQCNASSLLRRHSSKTIKKLLKSGCVQVLASDAHNITTRAPGLIQGIDSVSKFSDMLISNSIKVVENKPI